MVSCGYGIDWNVEVEMTFVTMQITVSLSADMEAAMPKSGDVEMHAIDAHSNAVDHIVDSRLHEIASDLTLNGYIVVVDESA